MDVTRNVFTGYNFQFIIRVRGGGIIDSTGCKRNPDMRSSGANNEWD